MQFHFIILLFKLQLKFVKDTLLISIIDHQRSISTKVWFGIGFLKFFLQLGFTTSISMTIEHSEKQELVFLFKVIPVKVYFSRAILVH